MKTLFSSHLQVTGKVLDLRLDRQNLVMGNLSNITTPNYKPRRMDFEDKLQQAMALDSRGKMTKTEESHLPAVFDANGFKGDAMKEFKPRYYYGEDTVNLDKEMAVMQKNVLAYNTLTQVMQSGFKGVNKVITDSKQ